MADINDVLADNRAAVSDLVAAAAKSAATWAAHRAPGKWSPSQVVDEACRGRASGQDLVNSGLGRVSLEDLVRFSALHTRHHCKQITGAN